MPWPGAERHTGKYPPLFALAAGDHSIAAAQRSGVLGPDAQQGPSRRAAPPPKQVEGWGPSSHKVPVREDQASLAPSPWGDKPGRQSVFASLKRKIP